MQPESVVTLTAQAGEKARYIRRFRHSLGMKSYFLLQVGQVRLHKLIWAMYLLTILRC